MFEELMTWWGTLEGPVRAGVETGMAVAGCVAARAVIMAVVRRRVEAQTSRYYWQKATQYLFTGFAVLIVLSLWFQGMGSLATYLGLVSAGLAVALKDPLSNMAGWVYVVWQRPFVVGDRVEIDGVIGDVVDQRLFAFRMLEVGGWVHGEQSTGRLVHVPNQRVFAHDLKNYTQDFDFIWDEIAVVFTFESDWRLAKEEVDALLHGRADVIVPAAQAQLDRVRSRSLIRYRNFSPIVYTSVVDHGVQLTMRYLCPTRRRRLEREQLWEGVLDLVAGCEALDLAYPTQRITGLSPQ